MKYENVDKWSFRYWILQHYVIPAYRVFYKKIYINNLKFINEGRPVIIAPNHQNALMDAMPFVCTSGYQPVFMARADIFKNSIIAFILRVMKIIPVFRIRDGYGNLKRNEGMFDLSADVLHNKRTPLVIMAEGNHGDKRTLRPLVKGIFRIAFKAQERYGKEKGVVIVPVGLDFSNYAKYRQKLLINYGEPIEVCEYFDLYSKDEAQGINAIKDRLAADMKKVMIHIEDDDYYNLSMNLRIICNDNVRENFCLGNNMYDSFKADKMIIAGVEEMKKTDIHTLNILKDRTEKYFEKLKHFRLCDRFFSKKKISIAGLFLKSVLLAAAFPLFVYGTVLNILPFIFPEMLIKKIKDKQFHSSVRYGAGLLLYLLFWIIIALIAFVTVEPLFAFIFIVSMPVSGLFALIYSSWLKKIIREIRFVILRMKKDNVFEEMFILRKEIIGIVMSNIRNTGYETHK